MSIVSIPNQAFINFLKDKDQFIVIDANLIIPPDRSSLNMNSSSKLNIELDKYIEHFLDPLIVYDHT